MRIWDISPGYLNRASLLGEHRELHGLMSIHINRKKGYSRHPETMRWRNFLNVLALRHELLVAEMRLRGYKHHSPLTIAPKADGYPNYLDSPARQFSILHEKYIGKEPGRIPLPKSVDELWQQHRLSVLARGESLYAEIEGNLASVDFDKLIEKLTSILYKRPRRRMLSKIAKMTTETGTTFDCETEIWTPEILNGENNDSSSISPANCPCFA